jgi:hypothetical protein
MGIARQYYTHRSLSLYSWGSRAIMPVVNKQVQKTVIVWYFYWFYPPFTLFSTHSFSNRPSTPLLIPHSRKPFRRGVYKSAQKFTVSGGGEGAGGCCGLSYQRADAGLREPPKPAETNPGYLTSPSLSKRLPGLYKIFRLFPSPVKATRRGDDQE